MRRPHAGRPDGTSSELPHRHRGRGRGARRHVEARIGEAIAYWNGAKGYRTEVLERAAEPDAAPRRQTACSRTFSGRGRASPRSGARGRRLDPRSAAHERVPRPRAHQRSGEQLERAIAGGDAAPGPSPAFTRAAFEVGSKPDRLRPCRRCRDRRAGPSLQPALSRGAERRRQDAPAQRDRQRADRLREPGGVSVRRAQAFIDELIAALQEGTVDRWRARYRAADALLIDDVQFVAGKERTQEELFHVFNALHAGRQADRVRQRPAAARAVGSRGAAAFALRGRTRRRSAVARPGAPRRSSMRGSTRRRRADARSRRGPWRPAGDERARDHGHREPTGRRPRKFAGVPLSLGDRPTR